MTTAEIADDMDARIRDGEYEPGARLPTYRDLAVLYGVGSTTIAQVIVRLKERGLVEGAIGQGVFVVDVLPPSR